MWRATILDVAETWGVRQVKGPKTMRTARGIWCYLLQVQYLQLWFAHPTKIPRPLRS